MNYEVNRVSKTSSMRARPAGRRSPSAIMRALLLLLVSAGLAFSFLPGSRNARAQQSSVTKNSVTMPQSQASTAVVPDSGEIINRAIAVVCSERGRDPLGSIPIDIMQSRPSIEMDHPEALVGADRARRLLPLAKDLVVQSIQKLASEEKIPEARVREAAARVREVNTIIPDPDLRDNAAVIMSDPHTIHFGTIFLVGLPSDEGMISVLAHELTHIADGRPNSLQPLFDLIGQRAAKKTGLPIRGQQPEELTCDLVGVMATQALIARTPNKEPAARRFARALEHNCVDDDDTDDEHLSPRNTMRAVLALDPTLARMIYPGE